MRAWTNEQSGSSAKVETPAHQERAVGGAPRGMPLQPVRTIVRIAAQELPGKRCTSGLRQTVVGKGIVGIRCRGRRFAHCSIQVSGGPRKLGGSALLETAGTGSELNHAVRGFSDKMMRICILLENSYRRDRIS